MVVKKPLWKIVPYIHILCTIVRHNDGFSCAFIEMHRSAFIYYTKNMPLNGGGISLGGINEKEEHKDYKEIDRPSL